MIDDRARRRCPSMEPDADHGAKRRIDSIRHPERRRCPSDGTRALIHRIGAEVGVRPVAVIDENFGCPSVERRGDGALTSAVIKCRAQS